MKDLEKPKPELVYDSCAIERYLVNKYKFRDYLLGDYIRKVFTEYSNGTQHTISDEDLDSEELTDEERKYLDTLLNEFGTVTKQLPDPDYREVIIHYWWWYDDSLSSNY